MIRRFFPCLVLLCSCTRDPLPAPAHFVVHLDTDAPVPAAGGLPSARPALFDTADVELVSSRPCVECTRRIALDDAALQAGASFTVDGTWAGAIIHVTLSLAARERGGARAAEVAEGFFVLPEAPADGARDVTAFVPVSALGAPLGSLDAPIAFADGTSPTHAGTFGVVSPDCGDAPQPGEVCVPGGAFWMGNRLILGDASSAADLQRIVVLSSFFVDAYEVTAGDFRAHIGGTTAVDAWSGSEAGTDYRDYCTYTLAPSDHDGLPVNCVTWTAARAYCNARGGDLPSEAELEYLVGARAGHLFPWGDDLATCADAVWGRGGGGTVPDVAPFGSPCTSGTTAAGHGPLPTARGAHGRDALTMPNGDVVFDLAGNISEWTRDFWNYQTSDCWGPRAPNVLEDPVCLTSPPEIGEIHPVRGGSWLVDAGELASSVRIGVRPTNQRPDIGFRCVRRVAP